MKAFLWFLLVPGGMAVYMVSVSVLGPHQRYPLVSFGLVLAGVIGLAVLTIRDATWWRGALTAVSLAMAIFFAWWIAGYSEYPEPSSDAVAAVGSPLGEAASGLVDPDGAPFDLPAHLAAHDATVLVFYRGHW